jgi:2'-5' RNA ligase
MRHVVEIMMDRNPCQTDRAWASQKKPKLRSLPALGLAGYNLPSHMQNPRYALVGYVKGPAGEFVENLRRELHPDLPHLAAHLTLLPPRILHDTEISALHLLERICSEAQPFEVALGDVETFTPATPTVYIRVSQGSARMCELHGQLNTQALECREEWPYTPHMTIVKMAAGQPVQNAFQIARERWASYAGSRRILLEKLSFVREDGQNCWVDLAPVLLGRTLVSR